MPPPVGPEELDLDVHQPWPHPGDIEFAQQFSDSPEAAYQVNAETAPDCGHILVADSENHRIQAFTCGGEFIAAFGSLGDAPGQFNYPQGVAVDAANRVLVVDRDNNRIVRLAYDGVEFRLLQSFEHGFNRPNDVAIDALGIIYVADTGNHRVVLMSDDGYFLTELRDLGDGRGSLQNPKGIAVDPARRVVIADTGNRRVVNLQPFVVELPKHAYLPLVRMANE